MRPHAFQLRLEPIQPIAIDAFETGRALAVEGGPPCSPSPRNSSTAIRLASTPAKCGSRWIGARSAGDVVTSE
jgi:hypothetical protein